MADREHKNIFWIDLETTGSELEDHDVIELGAAITDMELNVVDTKDFVFPLRRPVYPIKPVVLDMHIKNGLWEDVAEAQWTLKDADNELDEWVRGFSPRFHLPFAGSGVAHFDRQFIRRDFPKLDQRLTYWPIDVGVLRRTFLMFTQREWIAPQSDKTHRALDDVLFHIKEMKYAVDTLNGL